MRFAGPYPAALGSNDATEVSPLAFSIWTQSLLPAGIGLGISTCAWWLAPSGSAFDFIEPAASSVPYQRRMALTAGEPTGMVGGKP